MTLQPFGPPWYGMAGSRLASGAGGVSRGCTYATPREGGSRDNSKLAKSFTAASSRLWMRPSNSSGVENWSLSSPGADTAKPGGREVPAWRGGGGGGSTMRRGRGLRWTASSASMSLDLRVVSAVATPRCAPIFSNPASNRSEEHTSELQSLRHLVCRLLLEK